MGEPREILSEPATVDRVERIIAVVDGPGTAGAVVFRCTLSNGTQMHLFTPLTVGSRVTCTIREES